MFHCVLVVGFHVRLDGLLVLYFLIFLMFITPFGVIFMYRKGCGNLWLLHPVSTFIWFYGLLRRPGGIGAL